MVFHTHSKTGSISGMSLTTIHFLPVLMLLSNGIDPIRAQKSDRWTLTCHTEAIKLFMSVCRKSSMRKKSKWTGEALPNIIKHRGSLHRWVNWSQHLVLFVYMLQWQRQETRECLFVFSDQVWQLQLKIPAANKVTCVAGGEAAHAPPGMFNQEL